MSRGTWLISFFISSLLLSNIPQALLIHCLTYCLAYFFGNAKLGPYLINDKGEVVDYEK